MPGPSPDGGGVRVRGMLDIEYRVGRLTLTPGDVLVMKIKGRLSTDQITHVVRRLHQVVGEGTPVMVLDDQSDVLVLTRAEIEARTAA